jgi:glycosyltransferase involved in cell wall biosynthesis
MAQTGTRILMTADTVGGVWTYALELVRSLDEFGVEVALATMGKPLSREQRHRIRGVRNLEVYPSSYRLEWMDDPWRDIGEAGDWLLSLRDELHPDLIHLNSYCHARLDWRLPVLLVAHSDVYSWFEHVRRSAPGPEWQRYHAEVSWGIQAVDRVIAPTQAVLEDLRRHYGQLPAARVIPNGSDPSRFHSGRKRPVILSVGRLWDEGKNVLSLEKIAGELPWKVEVAGASRSPDGGELVLKNVIALGQLAPDELRDLYARASIYALPARYEPFGLSVLEAALSGCALVLGDIASLRENWEHAAIFVDPEDPAAIREALLMLIDNPSVLEQYAQAAYERARFFSSRRMASAYFGEYSRLVRPQLPFSQEQPMIGKVL